MLMNIKPHFLRFKDWLASLSFRTGIIVLLLCLLCYAISFLQMLLPSEWLSIEGKGVVWFVFFGLAKTFQYTALLILGKEGWQRVRAYIKKRS